MRNGNDMTSNLTTLVGAYIPALANGQYIETFLEFDVSILTPEQRIRAFCIENKCGNYNAHYMCPPHIGTITEINERLRTYDRGILIRYSKSVDVQHNRLGVVETKVEFHRIVLHLEDVLKEQGVTNRWGMIGGSCGLCEECKVRSSEPCPYPSEARTSLESIGIDILSFLDAFGLDNKFYPDKIIWTGCILFK